MTNRTHWQARWETYAAAAKEKAREYREARASGFENEEWYAMTQRLFRKYLRIAREARAHLDAMKEKRDAA